ncbi:MAG: hypothetical protein HC850_11615 [Rhodomicrobium sp.]|nr:hypothetical protein [Rhodomicrobium sp.]
MRAFYLAVIAAAAFALLPAEAQADSHCVKKAGQGWGITRSIAEFQAYEIIQQVTGNWPVATDKISKPVYSCKGGEGSWTCIARATVCKKA